MSEDNAKKGIYVGSGITATGAGLYGATKAGKLIKPEKRLAAARKLVDVTGSTKAARNLIESSKKSGKIAMVTGGVVTGVSAYKHYKNKKKENDNTEK